jgi:hypothetical protein
MAISWYDYKGGSLVSSLDGLGVEFGFADTSDLPGH